MTKKRRKKSSYFSLNRLLWIFVPRIVFVGFLIGGFFLLDYLSTPTVTVLRTDQVLSTAYSSTLDQTDDTPCITADGFDLCENWEENSIAANYLPFKTKIRLPEIFGERILVVHDHMHSRYGPNRIDVWLKSREAAIDFGAKILDLEIVEVEPSWFNKHFSN